MTTIATYSDLVTAFTSDWPARSDIAAVADTIIQLAEAVFNAKLRMRQMETTATLTPVSNLCTLPSDYLESKRVVEVASIRRRLEYITEDAADALYPDRASGLACNFTIMGTQLQAFPLSSNNIELTYYQKIPGLTSTNTTNWLLTAHPNFYLHACLLYVGEYIKDADRISTESQFLQSYIDLMNSVEARGKFGNAGVTLTGCTP
jgi:hypothetical protein